MKYLTLTAFALFLLSSTSAVSQNILEYKFGASAIQEIEGTEKLAILEFQNRHGYAVQDLSGVKDISEYPNALEVQPIIGNTEALDTSIENNSFDLFAYSFPVEHNTQKYYRIGDSGRLLVIYSTATVKSLFNEQTADSE